MSLIRKNRKIC